jgi:hypothetical protein
VSNPPDASHPSPNADHAFDATRAVWQLRVLVCGLGLGLVALSAVFTLFVWWQYANLTAETRNRVHQASQLKAAREQLAPVLNDLGAYSQSNAEVRAVIEKFGGQVYLQPATNAPGQDSPAP